MKKLNLLNKKFGKLLVIDTAPSSKSGQSMWVCQCDCGNTIITSGHSLNSGASKSCGCTRNEKIKNLNYTHGKSNTKIYKTWQDMKRRCNQQNSTDYYLYGGRGISICDEWNTNFMSFYSWAIDNGYSTELSIDRIDVNGNYEPNNCRWVDMYTQANNRRNSHIVTYHGEQGTLDNMCRKLNISSKLVRTRMKNKNLSFEQAIDNFSYKSPFVEYWKK